MFKTVISIDEKQIGTIGEFASDGDFYSCQPPLRTYKLRATPTPGQSMHDALSALMLVLDETNVVPTLTRIQFRDRFTKAEKVAMRLAEMTHASMEVRASLAIMREELSDVTDEGGVDVSRPDVQESVAGLAALGIIAPERVPVILAIPAE